VSAKRDAGQPGDLRIAPSVLSADFGLLAEQVGEVAPAADWLHDHEVAAVCSDNWAIEAIPGEYTDELLTVHMVLIRDMGLTLGEILDFEELGEDCAADGVYEFFFCSPPICSTKARSVPSK